MFDNFKLCESKITLDYSGSYFMNSNFGCEMINDECVLVLTLKDADRNARSIAYFVVNTDKTEAFSIPLSGNIYLSEQNYILTEKGARGFDFEVKLFICTTAKSDDGFIVTIIESPDENLRAELWELMNLKLVGNRNAFNECFVNSTLPNSSLDTGVNYETFLKRLVRKIKDTRFLDIDPEDKTHKYLCLDEPYTLNHLQVQMKNGLFAPYREGKVEDLNVAGYGFTIAGYGFTIA